MKYFSPIWETGNPNRDIAQRNTIPTRPFKQRSSSIYTDTLYASLCVAIGPWWQSELAAGGVIDCDPSDALIEQESDIVGIDDENSGIVGIDGEESDILGIKDAESVIGGIERRGTSGVQILRRRVQQHIREKDYLGERHYGTDRLNLYHGNQHYETAEE